MASRSPSLFFLQLRGELWKLFARKRTYLGFGAYVLIELLLLFLLQIPKNRAGMQRLIEAQGGFGAQYFSGLTLAFIIVSSTVFLIGPLYLALVSGDIVAKEVEEGTMRMILSRPASRLRVLGVRYVAVLLFTCVFIAFIVASALCAGLARQGFGDMFVFAPSQKILAFYEYAHGFHRFLLAIPLMALSFLTVTSLGFLFSCCNMKPAAATILCVSLYFIDLIFQGLPQFASMHEYFLTTHMFSWMNVFRDVVPKLTMVQDYAFLLGVDATLFVLGALIFQGRDFKA